MKDIYSQLISFIMNVFIFSVVDRKTKDSEPNGTMHSPNLIRL
jgi:hypothetical protein